MRPKFGIRRFLTIGLSMAIGMPVSTHAQVPPVQTQSTIGVPSLDMPIGARLEIMSPRPVSTSVREIMPTVAPGAQAFLRAEIKTTYRYGIPVQLRYPTGGLTGPSAVTIPAGSTYVNFTVTATTGAGPTKTTVTGWTIDSSSVSSVMLYISRPTP